MARIVVVGAGMGAMAAAARLAIAGHEVTVHERSGTHGGAVGAFTRDGFTFDTGPALLTLPAVYRDLFLKTGRTALEDVVPLAQVEPAVRHVFTDGSRADLPNASRAGVGEALDAALGAGAGERWAAFMNRAREAWDRSRRPLLEETLWPNWQVLADREPYPAVARRRFLRPASAASTAAEVVTYELGGDARLGALLGSHLLAHGLDPRSAPAGTAVLPYMEQTFGLWAAPGGVRALAAAVYARCLERRVRFRFGSEVRRIVVEDGRVRGVSATGALATGAPEVDTAAGQLEGPTQAGAVGTGAAGTGAAASSGEFLHEADLVVAGVPPEVLTRLLPDHPELHEPGSVPPQSSAPSRVVVLIALRGPRPASAPYRTVVHSTDAEEELRALFGTTPRLPAEPTVTVHRPDDPGAVPGPEHEALTITATVPAGSTAGPTDYEEFADRMVRAAERGTGPLADRQLWRVVRTPADVAAATGTEGVPAPALAAGGGQWLHRANSTRVRGLYAVGGWSHPGGGLPHAGMSGALVAGLIVEGPDFRGSR